VFDAAPSLTHVIAETRTVTAWFFMAISYSLRKEIYAFLVDLPCPACTHALGSEGCWPTRLAVKRG
jgi:hypothetical protein